MSTHELYVAAPEQAGWDVPMAGHSGFTWEYDDGRARLLALYQKGKDKQWDATRRIDWDLEVDPDDVLGVPDESIAIYGTRYWDQLGPENIKKLRLHLTSWQFSQFLHGEQGAMICAARIVESVPDLDSKFYAATQTMDEARHAYADMGVLDAARADLDALMRTDEEIAEKLDDERFAAEEAARADEVAQVIAEGA